DAARDAARFDALVLCGGDDVDARHFGETNHPTVETVPAIRDTYEMELVRRARDLGTPLLGVCRGAQVMNVALGGSLIQHIPDVPGTGAHRGGVSHEVRVEPGTRLASLGDGAATMTVNSFHHQAVGRLAPGLRIAARASDGIVEAVEAIDCAGPFFLGVQWHPEREGNPVPYGRGLFAELVAAARRSG
ncbi:MAG: gamma-glutamyl-gamma-aminobutyrate hydrolase family protein, partial [Planctomycetes bacterium]|nr:gamma-glutamyl-gamma-aminobutyrate hydrolase family protein [Planctomycetota bacterium]